MKPTRCVHAILPIFHLLLLNLPLLARSKVSFPSTDAASPNPTYLPEPIDVQESDSDPKQTEASHLFPESETELKELIIMHPKYHILGTFNGRHSTEGISISLSKMKEIHCCDFDSVYVSSGVSYRELIQELKQHGKAVEGVPRDIDANVVEAVINGQHSARYKGGLLADEVTEISLLMSNGVKKHYSIRDPEFKSIVLNYGYGGVTLGVFIKVVPEFEVLKCIYENILHYDFTRRFHAMFEGREYSWFFLDLGKMKWTVHQVYASNPEVPRKGTLCRVGVD